jgi:hypothetical protein
MSLLKKGLDTRVSHIAMQHQPTPSWPIDKEPPNPRNQPLVLGLVLDSKDAFRLIDKGPAANTPEVNYSKTFNLSFLRHIISCLNYKNSII